MMEIHSSFPPYEELPDGYTVTSFEGEKTTAAIEIDGVLDDAYLEATAIEILEINEGETDVTGFVYIIWDENYIYAYVVVNDTNVSRNKDAGQPWLFDSVEFVLDTWNNPSGQQQNYGEAYRPADYVGEGQFRVNAGENTLSGSLWMYDNTDIEKKGASRIINGEGYTAEYKIEWGTFQSNAAVGEQVAFAVVVNDGEDLTRDAIVSTDYDQNHAYEWAGVLSKLNLVDHNETVEPPANSDPSDPATSGDNGGIGSMVGSMLGCNASFTTMGSLTLIGAAVVVLAGKKREKRD